MNRLPKLERDTDQILDMVNTSKTGFTKIKSQLSMKTDNKIKARFKIFDVLKLFWSNKLRAKWKWIFNPTICFVTMIFEKRKFEIKRTKSQTPSYKPQINRKSLWLEVLSKLFIMVLYVWVKYLIQNSTTNWMMLKSRFECSRTTI